MLRRTLIPALLCCLFPSLVAALPAPTAENLPYDTKHERNVLDFWAAKTGSAPPAPVIVWFHGGGFRRGDKSDMRRRGAFMFERYHEAGYAIISCNYPLLSGKDGIGYEEIVRHCARAMRFIRSKSSEWKIDPDRICAAGASAGALISEALAYHDELDDDLSKDDPIAKFSRRPNVVVSHLQPIGTKGFALDHMDKGEAPIFIYSNAPDTDKLHHPNEAIKLRNKAVELGIPCVALSSGRNDLPEAKLGADWLQMQLEFCKTHLAAAKSKAKQR